MFGGGEGVGIPVPVLIVGLGRLTDCVFGLVSELVGLLDPAFELPELVCPTVPGFELVRGLVWFVLVSLGPGSASHVLVVFEFPTLVFPSFDLVPESRLSR